VRTRRGTSLLRVVVLILVVVFDAAMPAIVNCPATVLLGLSGRAVIVWTQVNYRRRNVPTVETSMEPQPEPAEFLICPTATMNSLVTLSVFTNVGQSSCPAFRSIYHAGKHERGRGASANHINWVGHRADANTRMSAINSDCWSNGLESLSAALQQSSIVLQREFQAPALHQRMSCLVAEYLQDD